MEGCPVLSYACVSVALAACFSLNVDGFFAPGMRYALAIELYTVVALCVVTTKLVG